MSTKDFMAQMISLQCNTGATMSNPTKKIISSMQIEFLNIFSKKHDTVAILKTPSDSKMRMTAVKLDSPIMEAIRADLSNLK